MVNNYYSSSSSISYHSDSDSSSEYEEPYYNCPSCHRNRGRFEGEDLVCFVDGSCKRNGQPNAAGGIGIYFRNDVIRPVQKELHRAFQNDIPNITNNSAELIAIRQALRIAVANGYRHDNIAICTDSQYALDCLFKWSHKWRRTGWRTVAGKKVVHRRLIREILKQLEDLNVTFYKCKAHG